MTLDYKGNLGIGKTVAEYPLDVAGIATFSDDVFVKSTLDVGASLTVGGNLQVDGVFNYPLPSVISGSNLNNSTGISTFLNIQVSETISGVSTIGIGTANIAKNVAIDAPFGTAIFNKVGVGTTGPTSQLEVDGAGHIKKFFAVGNQGPGCAVDFSNAGRGNLLTPQQNKMFMIPPKVTTTERGNLTDLQAGAIIYNTSTNKLQVYNGSSWANLH